jgi:hypothetical protein
MLEVGIFCVIVFAIGYWAALFIMGRREDVLHGEFVEAEPDLMPAAAGAPMPLSLARPTLAVPTKPPSPKYVSPNSVSAPPPAATSAPAPTPQPNAILTPAAVAAAVPPPAAAKAPASTDSLQSLLLSIKQELKNAAQI